MALNILNRENIRPEDYRANLADCVILTKDGKILMQQRPDDWHPHAGALCLFGGHVEEGENILGGLIRELREELGAHIQENEALHITTITEEETGHAEAVHVHFWHDNNGTITGCYEGIAVEYQTAKDALRHPKIMEYAAWALKECMQRGLIP